MLGTLLRKDGLAIAGGTMLLYTSVYFFERGGDAANLLI